MLISATIDSKYIKSDEIAGREVTLTISHVQMEMIGMAEDQESKPVLYFFSQNKGLVLNKTNRYLLKEALGDETENWANRKVILYVENTLFKGKPTKGLRIRIPTASKDERDQTAPWEQRPAPRTPPGPVANKITSPNVRDDLSAHTDQMPWEPIPSVVVEAEAMARQGINTFRDWKSRLSDTEFKDLEPELGRVLAMAKTADREIAKKAEQNG